AIGAVAGAPVTVTFDGDGSLRSRPMQRVLDPLKKMGARVVEVAESGRLPLTLQGAPCSVNGSRPDSATSTTRAPIFFNGSRTRCIGRLRRDPSPSKVTVTGAPATAPIASRQPVPELPKSSVPVGFANPPTPTP